MGKILNRLRQVIDAPVPSITEGRDNPAMPFIEIGPRKHLEASPDVLAVPLPAAMQRQGMPTPTISFRSLSPASPTVTKSRLAPELICFHNPNDPSAQKYRDLLKALLIAAGGKVQGACKSLLFTATRPEIGQTTILLNLAICAAQENRRVVVVDANFRRPGIATRLGLPTAPGLAEVLSDESALIEALQGTAQDNLLALTAGTEGTVFTDEATLRNLVEILSTQYDLVMIDAPRWEGRLVTMLAGIAQGVLLAAPEKEADSPPASELVRELPARGIPLVGCILTGS